MTLRSHDRRRNAKPTRTAAQAYAEHKASIDATLYALTALSARNFDNNAVTINWGHVGTLEEVARLLKQATDFLGGTAE